MTPDALKVATDILRELGMEDVAKWVEHSEAVRELLALNPYVGYDYVCQQCECDDGRSHLAMCRIAAAWRTLGDPRGAADIERAHEEALREQERRARPQTWDLSPEAGFTYSAPMTATAAAILHDNHQSLVARVEQVRRLIEDGHITMHDIERIVDEQTK